MSTSIFRLDVSQKTLTPLTAKTLQELKLSEPRDLETWLASSPSGVFAREALWISRQDRPTDDQRSDLIGLDDEGNLLVTELKRGELDEHAITQTLGYAAEYAQKTADDLAAIYAGQSIKNAAHGLINKAESLEDTQRRLSDHCGADTELNEAQILILVGEDFTPGVLAICDFLNKSSGDASFSMECWKYTVFQDQGSSKLFALEQLLPPPSVRLAIEERRAAAKAKRYARDPVRQEFMHKLMEFLNEKLPGLAKRSQGASYGCSLTKEEWKSKGTVRLSVKAEFPQLVLPKGIDLEGNSGDHEASREEKEDGSVVVTFGTIPCSTSKFDAPFGDKLLKLLDTVKAKPAQISAATLPTQQSASQGSQQQV